MPRSRGAGVIEEETAPDDGLEPSNAREEGCNEIRVENNREPPRTAARQQNMAFSRDSKPGALKGPNS